MSVLDYVRHHLWPCTLLITVISLPGPLAVAAPPSARPMVHGLWVWNAASILDSPAESKKLRDFAVAQRINEIYLSALSHGKFADAGALCSLVDSLHHSQVRSQALLSSTNADEPGEHRQRLLEEIKAVIHFDLEHAHCRFDGIHLDIEPQQRPENKGPGNLGFLPDLLAAYGEARKLAQPAGLTVDVDVAIKVLKADGGQRLALLRSADRVTVMLYQLNGATDGAFEQSADILRTAVRKVLVQTYAGLVADSDLADLVIGLRVQDYGESLPRMFELLDSTFDEDPHYRGWARHAYAISH